jgi:hypothetical protein
MHKTPSDWDLLITRYIRNQVTSQGRKKERKEGNDVYVERKNEMRSPSVLNSNERKEPMKPHHQRRKEELDIK